MTQEDWTLGGGGGGWLNNNTQHANYRWSKRRMLHVPSGASTLLLL